MNRQGIAELLKIQLAKKSFLEIKVGGISMLPLICPDDTVVVNRSNEYNCGDVILFLYNDNHILIHRLLRIDGDNYICKGDNSFQLEIINYDKILGRVISIRKGTALINLPIISDKMINLSYDIHKEFLKHNMDINMTKKSLSYKTYQEYLLNML